MLLGMSLTVVAIVNSALLFVPGVRRSPTLNSDYFRSLAAIGRRKKI
jgi:hypothetical protein